VTKKRYPEKYSRAAAMSVIIAASFEMPFIRNLCFMPFNESIMEA